MTHTRARESGGVALITGASRGIGRATALGLAGAGFDIAAVARPHSQTERACALSTLGCEVEALGRRFVDVHADVADLGCHGDIIEQAIERLGRIDVFVSNAGIAPDPRLDLLDMTPESFDRVLGVNLRGAVFLAQKVARVMMAQPERGGEAGSGSALGSEWPDTRALRGTMIFVTSVSAERSATNRAEYCVSKAGLSMVARVFADRLASEGIHVFEVRPGIIRTDMTAAAREKYDRLIAAGMVPQRRWGEPSDVARVIVSLARGDFGYSTGAIIDISGGLSIPRL